MSDHNERACSMCGSLLHHEDDCKRQGSNHDTLCAITTLLFPDRGCWSKGMLTDGIKSLQSQLAALKLENENLVELVRKMPAIKKQRPYDDDKPDEYLESFRNRSENNRLAVEWFLENGDALRAEIERAKDANPQTNFNQT